MFKAHATDYSNRGLWSLRNVGQVVVMDVMNPLIDSIDFDERPFIAIWEVTQACDLACVHCRALARPNRNPFELSTAEGRQLIDQISSLEVPVFVLTGGDRSKGRTCLNLSNMRGRLEFVFRLHQAPARF
jgi:hypothetical protein